MTLFDLKAKDNDTEEDHNPPFVPSHGIIAIQFGIPHLLYHQGTDLDYWVAEIGVDYTAKEMAGDTSSDKDGIYVWSGHHRGWKDYWGEYDEELEATEFRPITKAEWEAFVADEIVWDLDAMKAKLDWDFALEKKEREREENAP